jgi:single-strand DNA-binding protein
MDLNLVVLAGRLAAPPEIRTFESGARMVRYLVTVRSEEPRRRVDVVPVTDWNPAAVDSARRAHLGMRLWVAGGVQRRFWDDDTGRRSRLEIVAHQVELRDEDEDDVEAE